MIKLAIVDDDTRLSRLLKSELLEFPEIDSVITFPNGEAFVAELGTMNPEKRPDVVIMDISMGSAKEGIVTTGRIRMKFDNIRVIMFTVTDEEDYIFDAFRAGATGYLLKDEKPEFIMKTITDVYSGGAQMSPSIARKTIRSFAPEGNNTTKQKSSAEKSLTEQELRILGFVSEGHTYAAIAEKLFISTNTVKKHMANIFEKLHVRNKIQAIREIGDQR